MDAVDEGVAQDFDPEDVARNTLPSDDEEGPDDPDDEEDALPPGGLGNEEADDDGTAMEIDAEAGAATSGVVLRGKSEMCELRKKERRF